MVVKMKNDLKMLEEAYEYSRSKIKWQSYFLVAVHYEAILLSNITNASYFDQLKKLYHKFYRRTSWERGGRFSNSVYGKKLKGE